MVSGISLANKCQLLFGAAAVVILAAALSVPWMRTSSMVHDSQLQVARQLADAWLSDRIHLGTLDAPEQGGLPPSLAGEVRENIDAPHFRMSLAKIADIDPKDESRPFLTAALAQFTESPQQSEYLSTVTIEGRPFYRYARAIRESQMRAINDRAAGETVGPPMEPDANDPLQAILIIDRSSPFAAGQLLTSRVYIISAGIVATLLAGLVFHYILTRLIFVPVRTLRETAEKVQAGNVRTRAQIKTGDEFEQLSEAFNSMLDQLEQNQGQLKSMNESLDLKVTELAEANVGLYESNRFKSEFLANVSHELRTPLNSIIGFAELLEEMGRADSDASGAASGGGGGGDSKRLRYITNILTSGRSLLDMINELLDMAKIEAGRMEVNIEPTSVGDLIEGLVGIMRPQSQAKKIELRTVIAQRLPVIETDPGKLQQILYNFLSNAIKFTPASGTVTISADRVTRQDNSLGVRISVADTGPGIPYDMQDVIFEKFRQIDASHTREHAGTGLGLAICRELAQMLNATVSFVSEPGRGATFFVDLPLTHQPQAPQPLMAGA